jgi:RimJ/RimL family protein N-acetyltransferase
MSAGAHGTHSPARPVEGATEAAAQNTAQDAASGAATGAALDADHPRARPQDGTQDRPIIRGAHVLLRPPERADIPLFVAWLNDYETSRHLTTRAPLSIPLEERWFEDMLTRQGKDAWHFVICLLADQRPIGTAGLFGLDLLNGQAGFGIFIGVHALWNRGYGTDALEAICDFGFGELRLERIWLDVFTDNARAKRSYEKAGFSVEGILRHDMYRSGRFQDVFRMSLLRAEWEALPRPRSWERDVP